MTDKELLELAAKVNAEYGMSTQVNSFAILEMVNLIRMMKEALFSCRQWKFAGTEYQAYDKEDVDEALAAVERWEKGESEAADEIISLRQQVQELERSAKAWEEDALRYHKDAEFWKAKHLEAQAREAKLREALKGLVRCMDDEEYSTQMQMNLSRADKALALPHDDTALKEYRKRVLLEVANFLGLSESADVRYYADELRRMAEETK